MNATSTKPIQEVLDRLGESVKKAGGGWSAKCPAHDDRLASLSIKTGDDERVLLHCHAGCGVQSIVEKLGLKVADLFVPKETHNGNGRQRTLGPIVKTYDYFDEEGKFRHQTTRHSPKNFRQRHKVDDEWVWNLQGIATILYRLPELLNAQEDRTDDWRFICEGEKDVDRLWESGLIATCNPMGAGKWQDRYSDIFHGYRCCIIADKDEPGRKHARQVSASLKSHGAADVRIIECPGEKVKDASDWFDAGGTSDGLVQLAAAAIDTVSTEHQETAGDDDHDRQGDDRATELAAAEEMHRRHGAVIRYHADRGEYFTWKRTHWARDIDGQVVRLAKQTAKLSSARLLDVVDERELQRFQKKIESANAISAVLRLLQSEPSITVTSGDFDRDDYLLNCVNGTVELKTGELRPHATDDLITHCLTTPYDSGARCPRWESVVQRSLPDEAVASYFQRWCGLFLTGSPNVQELLIAYGTGANGKSVLFDTLLGLLGPYAGVAPESLLVTRHGQSEHPTEIADLLGKRLVTASETESGATFRIQLIKRLTGDATIKARFMRQDFFEFRRTHKLVLITNNRPRLTENTEAVWRRLRLMPFNVVIPASERDPELLDKLKGEWPGILAWCVRGLHDLLANGMNPPPAVLVATDEYRDESDELAEFINSRCITGDAETFRASRADLWAAYTSWAKESNERHPLERNPFYEAIRRRDGIQDGVWKGGGQAIRGFKGIGMAAPAPEGCR